MGQGPARGVLWSQEEETDKGAGKGKRAKSDPFTQASFRGKGQNLTGACFLGNSASNSNEAWDLAKSLFCFVFFLSSNQPRVLGSGRAWRGWGPHALGAAGEC